VIRLPSRAERMQVLRGGPVETKRGFVLHTADFFLNRRPCRSTRASA
jgi:putative transcriptional regulator